MLGRISCIGIPALLRRVASSDDSRRLRHVVTQFVHPLLHIFTLVQLCLLVCLNQNQYVCIACFCCRSHVPLSHFRASFPHYGSFNHDLHFVLLLILQFCSCLLTFFLVEIRLVTSCTLYLNFITSSYSFSLKIPKWRSRSDTAVLIEALWTTLFTQEPASRRPRSALKIGRIHS